MRQRDKRHLGEWIIYSGEIQQDYIPSVAEAVMILFFQPLHGNVGRKTYTVIL